MSKYKYEASAWMCDFNDPVHVFRPEVVGEYRKSERRAQSHAVAIVAALEAAKGLHVANELELDASESPNASEYVKADRQLTQARGRFHDAMSTLLQLERGDSIAPKKRLKKIHYSGGLRWTAGRTVTTHARGFASCATGKRAEKIRSAGNQTEKPNLVTCSRCRHLLERSGREERAENYDDCE